MSGYTKLFSSILMSSIWEESNETRLVWVTMLALADQHGHVDGTVKSLARVSRVTVEQCQEALTCLLGPDEDDRSRVLNGRRIVPEEGGWRLVNYARYRRQMSADERRERDKIRKRQARESARRPQVSEFVRDVSQAEAEAEASPKAEQNRTEKKQERAPRGGSALGPTSLEREKLLRHNAYVGARLRVPTKLHQDFIAQLGGDEPDTALRAFYATVDEEIERTREPIVPDVWKWLTARVVPWMQARAGDAEMAKFLAGEV